MLQFQSFMGQQVIFRPERCAESEETLEEAVIFLTLVSLPLCFHTEVKPAALRERRRRKSFYLPTNLSSVPRLLNGEHPVPAVSEQTAPRAAFLCPAAA